MDFIRRTYLVHYLFTKEIPHAQPNGKERLLARSGQGRYINETSVDLTEAKGIRALEEKIRKEYDYINVIVLSFQLLNRRFVWPFSKEPEPVVEKQPEPRPYHRQVFANGIWQADLPADNLEALKVILSLFKLHEGNIELERSDKVDDTLMSEGRDEEGFLFRAFFWLERNPGA